MYTLDNNFFIAVFDINLALTNWTRFCVCFCETSHFHHGNLTVESQSLLRRADSFAKGIKRNFPMLHKWRFMYLRATAKISNFQPDLHNLNLFHSLIFTPLACERTLECLKTLFQPLCFARLVLILQCFDKIEI